jgi:hypothetical protein
MYDDKATIITHSGPNPKVFFDLKVRASEWTFVGQQGASL